VHFSRVPFVVKVAQCSDSDQIEVDGAEAIHWTLIPQHGVRLGVLVRAKGDAEPAEGRFNGTQESAFQAGDRIELRLFLDNMTDAPLRLNVGSGAFHLLVRRAGLDTPGELIPPARAQADGPAKEVTIPPHAQKELAKRRLNDSYDLPVGDYQLEIGPVHLAGAAARANTPTAGWPFLEDGAVAGGLIKVLPQ